MSSTCDTCQKKIGGGLFTNENLTDNVNNFLKKNYSDKEHWCKACARQAIELYFNPDTIKKELSLLEKDYTAYVKKNIPKFKLHTTNEYVGEHVGFVTGYSALGTGFLTEIASTFTDAFGVQSGSYKQKLNESEMTAKKDIIHKAIDLGGTAIHGTKFQIIEATSGNGILICYFSGMAIKEKNMDNDFYHMHTLMKNLKEKNTKIEEYSALLSFF